MKKISVLLLLAVVILFSFNSCRKHEESMYNKSKHQIQYIWYKSNVGQPNEVFSYSKHITTYLLDKIEILDSANVNGIRTEIFEFKYNKDNTVASVVYNNGQYTETIKFAYLDKLVKYMSYSVDDTVRLVANFYRDNEKEQKITRITEIYEFAFFSRYEYISKSLMFRHFIGDPAIVSEMLTSNAKDLTLKCTKEVTYEGENIVSIKEDYPELQKQIVTEYRYDLDVVNPFHGLCYAYDGLLGFSQKSPSHKNTTISYDGNITDKETIVYDYYDVTKDKYPRQFSYNSSKNSYIPFKQYITYRDEYKK